jgi:hypothetical protein
VRTSAEAERRELGLAQVEVAAQEAASADPGRAGGVLLLAEGGAGRGGTRGTDARGRLRPRLRRLRRAPGPEVEGGFDISRSRVDPEVRELFISNENSNDDVGIVPGVGPVTAGILKRKSSNPPIGVHSVAQLLGKFLTLRKPNLTPQQHCDAFALWLADIGVNSRSIHNIVLVVSDKAGSLMPRLRYSGIVARE